MAVALLLPAVAPASALVVEASGASADGGNVRVAVYSSRVGFPDAPRYTEAAPAAGPLRWEVADLPTGDYVVLVWQDRNDNGELDRSMFGTAQEPYGFAGGSREKLPDWEQVRFALGPDPLTVQVRIE